MEKKRTFGVRLTEFLFRLHARLPLGYHYAWGRFVTWLVRDVFRYRTDVVLTNLSRSFPEKDYDAIKDIYKQFYIHFGELFAEAIWFSGCRGEKGRRRLIRQNICEIDNIEEFNAFYDRSSSVMLLNSHAGNWELMGGVGQYDQLAPGQRTWSEKNVVVLYRALSSKFWDQVMADGRCAPVADRDFEGYVEGSAILRYAGVTEKIAMPESYNEIDFEKLYLLKDKYENIYARVEKRLESEWESTIALLEKGQAEGVIKPVNIPLVKLIYEASIEQFFKRDVLVANNIPYNAAIKEVVSILIEGIRAR